MTSFCPIAMTPVDSNMYSTPFPKYSMATREANLIKERCSCILDILKVIGKGLDNIETNLFVLKGKRNIYQNCGVTVVSKKLFVPHFPQEPDARSVIPSRLNFTSSRKSVFTLNPLHCCEVICGTGLVDDVRVEKQCDMIEDHFDRGTQLFVIQAIAYWKQGFVLKNDKTVFQYGTGCGRKNGCQAAHSASQPNYSDNSYKVIRDRIFEKGIDYETLGILFAWGLTKEDCEKLMEMCRADKSLYRPESLYRPQSLTEYKYDCIVCDCIMRKLLGDIAPKGLTIEQRRIMKNFFGVKDEEIEVFQDAWERSLNKMETFHVLVEEFTSDIKKRWISKNCYAYQSLSSTVQLPSDVNVHDSLLEVDLRSRRLEILNKVSEGSLLPSEALECWLNDQRCFLDKSQREITEKLLIIENIKNGEDNLFVYERLIGRWLDVDSFIEAESKKCLPGFNGDATRKKHAVYSQTLLQGYFFKIEDVFKEYTKFHELGNKHSPGDSSFKKGINSECAIICLDLKANLTSEFYKNLKVNGNKDPILFAKKSKKDHSAKKKEMEANHISLTQHFKKSFLNPLSVSEHLVNLKAKVLESPWKPRCFDAFEKKLKTMQVLCDMRMKSLRYMSPDELLFSVCVEKDVSLVEEFYGKCVEKVRRLMNDQEMRAESLAIIKRMMVFGRVEVREVKFASPKKAVPLVTPSQSQAKSSAILSERVSK